MFRASVKNLQSCMTMFVWLGLVIFSMPKDSLNIYGHLHREWCRSTMTNYAEPSMRILVKNNPRAASSEHFYVRNHRL